MVYRDLLWTFWNIACDEWATPAEGDAIVIYVVIHNFASLLHTHMCSVHSMHVMSDLLGHAHLSVKNSSEVCPQTILWMSLRLT